MGSQWVERCQGQDECWRTLDIFRSTGLEEENDPEVIMYSTKDRSDLVAITVALEAANTAIHLAKRVRAPLRSIAEQVVRSASSVPANLAEGHGRTGKDRAYHWRIAFASAKEVECHLRLLESSGAIPRDKAADAMALFDRARALTWRLMHPDSDRA